MVVPVDSTGSDGIGRLILGLTWTFTGLAIIVVVARFIIRKRISKSWSADDWIMLLALVLQVVYQAEFTVLVSWGEGLPYDRLTAVQKITKSKWGYISAIPSILTSCIARISIAILLVRIFGVRRWIKWYLIIFTSLETILSILSIIFLVAQCTPWSGLWDHTIKAKCWDPFIYAYTALATQFLNAIYDITFVLFPVIIIWKLNMPTNRKIALAGLISLSLVTAGIVITKITVVLLRLTTTYISTGTLSHYYQSLTDLVACLEQSLVIIMGCIPTLRLPAHFKLPSIGAIGSWVASLVSSARSLRSRSGRGSSYNSSEDSSYHDLELVPKIRIPEEGGEGFPYTVTRVGNTPHGYDLPVKKGEERKITQRTEFSVEYS